MLKNSTLLPLYFLEVLDLFKVYRYYFFLLQIAINTFYNLYYDYWNLISKF